MARNIEDIYNDYCDHKISRPDYCLFDGEEWGDEICSGCWLKWPDCPEDYYDNKCPRHDLVLAADFAAFKANEEIYQLFRNKSEVME